MLSIIFMAKETYSSVKSLKFLSKRNDIKILKAVVRDTDFKIKKLCSENHIDMCSEDELVEEYRKGSLSIDYIFSYYWKRVKKEPLEIPIRGSINFHPGPLPEARGSGYHMAILENWGYFGVTAHYMDEQFDTGRIIECRRFPIPANIVNKDLVQLTHENLFILFKDVVNRLGGGYELPGTSQEEGRYFSLPDLEHAKTILETDSSMLIDRKVRAFWNPPYSGAQVEIKGKRYTVINDEILEWIAKRMSIKENS